ncbi:hypothetical protein JQR88_24520 (plasmid) [Pseudomonas luteola]|uniref:hypothetical protein n=1 Tax=Pseudomonas luteola TaxID=47886 RepID=UPI003DA18208
MSEYFEWEEAVVEQVAVALDASHSDGSAIVEAQLFRLQQAWSMCMDAEQAARIVVEASEAYRLANLAGRQSDGLFA